MNITLAHFSEFAALADRYRLAEAELAACSATLQQHVRTVMREIFSVDEKKPETQDQIDFITFLRELESNPSAAIQIGLLWAAVSRRLLATTDLPPAATAGTAAKSRPRPRPHTSTSKAGAEPQAAKRAPGRARPRGVRG